MSIYTWLRAYSAEFAKTDSVFAIFSRPPYKISGRAGFLTECGRGAFIFAKDFPARELHLAVF